MCKFCGSSETPCKCLDLEEQDMMASLAACLPGYTIEELLQILPIPVEVE
jgi:hypothetical protein